MAQMRDHATYQLYETYHAPVHVLRDVRTYDHFASAHSRTLRQAELLTAYMQQLLEAIRSDVNERGDCWLLRAIVSRELPAIHLLDHSAIACVYAEFFTPEEAPVPDSRSIPYSSAYSSSAGGMLYTDRRARTCVLDLRSDSMLHPLCHALLMHAARKEMERSVFRLTEEKNALGSRITQLSDRILGLERDLAQAQKPAVVAADDVPSAGEASSANE